MADTPQIEVYFVNSGENPHGVGEAAIPPIGPAVANALRLATGEPIRALPIRTREIDS
jgi:isoquinoline 1-oxidoreductase beta subunit